jgi:hypothetical protein
MLAAGSLVATGTAFRVGVGCLELWVERTPPLLGLAATASIGGRDPRRAQAAFRDDLIGLARESAERSWRELRRGVDQFDALTRPRDNEPGTRPHRPYRVKP